MIWTIRHGISSLGVQRRLSGRNAASLAPEGIAQVRATAQFLTRARECSAPDRQWCLVTSGVQRALESAEILADSLSIEDLTIRDDLAETDFGDWDGLTAAEITAKWPEIVARWLKDDDTRPPRGETFRESAIRSSASFESIAREKLNDQITIVVTHSNPIRSLLGAATVGRRDLVVRHADLDFASLSRFGFDAESDQWRLLTWNEIS